MRFPFWAILCSFVIVLFSGCAGQIQYLRPVALPTGEIVEKQGYFLLKKQTANFTLACESFVADREMRVVVSLANSSGFPITISEKDISVSFPGEERRLYGKAYRMSGERIGVAGTRAQPASGVPEKDIREEVIYPGYLLAAQYIFDLPRVHFPLKIHFVIEDEAFSVDFDKK